MFNTTTLYSSASSERVRSHYKTRQIKINSSKLFGRRILLDGNSTLILEMHNRDCDRRTSNPCDCCRMWVLQHYSRERSRDFSILSICIRLKIDCKGIVTILTKVYLICRERIVQRRAKIRETATSQLQISPWGKRSIFTITTSLR